MTEAVQVAGTCDLICNLKAAVTALECQQKMNMLKKQALQEPRKPSSPPMFVMIPLEEHMNGNGGGVFEDKLKRKRKNHHDYESEYSADSSASSYSSTTNQHRRDGCNNSNGPGIRGGILHSRCNCIHRDGLQDSCPLTECQDEPHCMTKPWANCPPAKYFRARFPDNYP